MCVDDQILLRETLIYMLSQDDEISAFDGGADGYEALKNCNLLRPDVILMDIRMPNLDGIEATRQIKALYPSIKVIILTTFEDEKNVFESIEIGADGYVVKDIKPDELKLAVKSVYHNLYVMHNSIIRLVKGKIAGAQSREKDQKKMLTDIDLTPMEVRIIKHIIDGKSNKEIASALSFTEGTIKNKVSRMLGKMDLKDRTQVAVFAVQHNLI